MLSFIIRYVLYILLVMIKTKIERF